MDLTLYSFHTLSLDHILCIGDSCEVVIFKIYICNLTETVIWSIYAFAEGDTEQ